MGCPVTNEYTTFSTVRGNQPLFISKFAWLAVIEVAGSMELIGIEDAFGWEIKHVRENSNVSILLISIGIHQECKIIRTKTYSVWVELVCHVQYLV